jgi:hypothetical protein
VRWSPPACRREVFRSPRPILLLAPGIFIAIFLLVESSNGVVYSVPPSKKPCELAVPSLACPKMLKTLTNLPILTFIPGSIRNRCNKVLRLPSLIKTCFNNSPRIAPLGLDATSGEICLHHLSASHLDAAFQCGLVGPSLWEVCFGMHMNKRNRCPRCQSQNIHRSRRQGVLERLFCAVFFVIPFRCEVCDKRYFRSRFPMYLEHQTL